MTTGTQNVGQRLLPPQVPDEYDRYTLQLIVETLLQRIEILETAAAPSTGTVTNKTVSRSLDCDTATTAELADFVGTMHDDLQNKGVL